MTLRVALEIDGDASGGERALAQIIAGLTELQDKFKSAAAAAGRNNAASDAADKAHGAAAKAAQAHADSVAELARQAADLAARVAGAESQLAKLAQGLSAISVAGGRLAGAGGLLGAVAGGLGLIAAAATAYFALVPDRAAQADVALREHERLIGLIKAAYGGAANEAAKFFDQSKQVTELQLRQNQIALQASLLAHSRAAMLAAGREVPAGGLSDMGIGPLPGQIPDQLEIEQRFKVFEGAITRFNDSIARGAPDVKRYIDELAAIGLAAGAANPEVQRLAAQLIEQAKGALDTANALEKIQASLDLIAGRNVKTSKDRLGISGQGEASEYERLSKLSARRADQLRIEAEAFDLPAAAAAKYRVEQELLAAAERDGIELSAKQEKANRAVAESAGEATAKLEGLKLIAELRSPTEALNKEMERLNELLALGAIGWDTYEAAASRAAYNAFAATQQALEGERQMRMGVAQHAIALLNVVGEKNKAAALAVIAISKGLATAQVIHQTAIASMAALAPPPVGLGPVAGAGLAASIQALGAAQIGLIAATGIAEGVKALSGGSAPPAAAAAGGAPAPASGAAATGVEGGPVQFATLNVDMSGRRLFSREDLLELFDSINELARDGAQLSVRVIG